MLTSYFGGQDLISNCLYDFFFTNDGKVLPVHHDLGESEGKNVIG